MIRKAEPVYCAGKGCESWLELYKCLPELTVSLHSGLSLMHKIWPQSCDCGLLSTAEKENAREPIDGVGLGDGLAVLFS